MVITMVLMMMVVAMTSAITISNDARIHQAAIRLATVAKSVGVPDDSMRRFVRAGYVPQPKQLQFHAAARECDLPDGPEYIGFGGARGPGKSHAVFAQIALDDCQRVPNLKVLYLRKISKNAREQFEDLRRVVLRNIEHNYNRSTGVLTFPNNSRIVIGHFRNEGDVDQYLGLEYDVVAIEEATTLTLAKFGALRDSNRTSKPHWRPRIYTSTNPGGVGHAWYKNLFIKPAREGCETETRFIFATIDDNTFVDAGYKRKLEKNTGWRLRAYRYGDWDIAAGQFFSTWRYDAHVIDPFDVPLHWSMWGSLDYGFTHPTAVYLLSEFDGDIYVVDEHVAAKQLPSQHAADIHSMLARHNRTVTDLEEFVAGADAFQKRGDKEGKTIADQYDELGIVLTPANTNRITGAGRVLELLGNLDAKPEPVEPRLKIFSRCARLIECIPSMQHNPRRPEDVLKVDVDEDGNGGDDPYDCVRYGVMVERVPYVPSAIGGVRAPVAMR